MKHSIFFISIICSFYGFSQNANPELAQTWHLNFVQSNDLSTPYTVSEINPEITPLLIIADDLTFTGEGACNTFNGAFEAPAAGYLQTPQFNSTSTDCGFQVHNFFEDSYFSFLQSGGDYEITTENDGLVLTIRNPIFGMAIFRNFVLKTDDFVSDSRVEMWPNPCNSTLFINYNRLALTHVYLIDSLGQTVKEIDNRIVTVDVSDLAAGIYFLKITTDNATIIKKILKSK